jgi:uncharacterized damage-inducible protein DinB
VYSRAAILDLLAHMEWADGEVWRAVLACEAAAGDPRIGDRLRHLHAVQQAFLAVWRNEPVTFPDLAAFPDLRAVRDWSRPYYADARAFLQGLAPGALAAPVVMPWAAELARQLGRDPGTPTLGETAFQVSSHSTYHRGQVNARLRELGGEPPLVDYIAWIWFERPAPRQG